MQAYTGWRRKNATTLIVNFKDIINKTELILILLCGKFIFQQNDTIRVVATVGGAAHHLRFPPGTKKRKKISARHNFFFFFFFFFLVPGTMFHNRGSIIAQYTYGIYGTAKKKCPGYLVGNLVATNWPIEKALHAIGYNQIPTK